MLLKQDIRIRSSSKSHIIKPFRSIIAGFLTQKVAQSHAFLHFIMTSSDVIHCYSGLQSKHIVKTGRRGMVTYDTTSNKDSLLSGAAALAVEVCKLGSLSRKRYGGLLSDPVCVCGFEKPLSDG